MLLTCHSTLIIAQDSSFRRALGNILSGMVFNTKTESPVGGVKIKITNTTTGIIKEIRNDNNGLFYIDLKEFPSFTIRIAPFGFEAYESEVYKAKDIVEKYGRKIPTVYLTSTINIAVKDTVALPPDEFLERRLDSLNFLPSPSAYAVLFALNPALKTMDKVPPGYKIVIPETPTLSSDERRNFESQFLYFDAKKDDVLKGQLKDSITTFQQYHAQIKTIIELKINKSLLDSFKLISESITNDLDEYRQDLKKARRGVLLQMTALVHTATDKLRHVLNTQKLSEVEFEQFLLIGRRIALFVSTASYRKLFANNHSENKATERADSFYMIPAAYTPNSFMYEENSLPNRDLRMFQINIFLQKNGRIISNEPEIMNRYMIVCYPPGLKPIEELHIKANQPASTASITLSNASYEFTVLDLITQKKMIFIKGNTETETQNTDNAFREWARNLAGPNTFKILLYIKE